MADDRKYYVLCGANCKFEGMTKEQIMTAINQAVTTGTIRDIDAGFITRIVEQNKGVAMYIWVGTQAEYNALEEKSDDCHYIITDAKTDTDALETEVEALQDDLSALRKSYTTQQNLLMEMYQSTLKLNNHIANINKTLYTAPDTYYGTDEGATIDFDDTKHSLFAVTVCGCFGNNFDVLCRKTYDPNTEETTISGFGGMRTPDGELSIYARVTIANGKIVVCQDKCENNSESIVQDWAASSIIRIKGVI